jgi:hypothetical protein
MLKRMERKVDGENSMGEGDQRKMVRDGMKITKGGNRKTGQRIYFIEQRLLIQTPAKPITV